MLKPETKKYQTLLALYCKNGKIPEIPGASLNRLRHYRRLVFNVIDGIMQQAYPITLSILHPDEWNLLIDYFFSRHQCQTPQIYRLPFELIQFYTTEPFPQQLSQKYPFLLDLLRFEWVEIEVFTAKDYPYKNVKKEFNQTDNLLKSIIVPVQEHKLLELSYPVFKKAFFQQRDLDQKRYILLIYRKAGSFQVKYMELSPAAFFLWMQLKEFTPLYQIFDKLKSLFPSLTADQLTSTILEWRKKGLIAGIKNR
jgi:hypothetical protein